MLVSTSFTNANLTPTRHLKIGLSRKKNIKVHSPKSRYFFMCYRWKQKVSENALVERSVFHQKNNIIWQLLPFEKCFLLNFFFSKKFSAYKTMKYFITLKFLFELCLIKPQTFVRPLPRNYTNIEVTVAISGLIWKVSNAEIAQIVFLIIIRLKFN